MRRLVGAVLIGLLGLGCHEGTGSDLGPETRGEQAYDYRVLVLDDDGLPVVGTVVRFAGSEASAVTGPTGRAFYPERRTGRQLLTVDGAQAAARDGGGYGTLSLVAEPPDGDELPFAFYLPDHGSSFGLELPSGVQVGARTLDDDPAAVPADARRSGARLTIDAGETVTFGTMPTVELRTGKLSPGHLPLPVEGFPVLVSRSVYVHPAGVTFANGADLSIPDDLNLTPGRAVNLFHLDAATGTWVTAGAAAESGGRLVATGLVRRGGLYAFAIVPAATTDVSGRILDAEGLPLDGVLVRGPEAAARTGADGRFTLSALARFDGQGNTRTVTLEMHGGRRLLPTGNRTTAVLSDGTVDLGDLRLDTVPAANLVLRLINRGLPVVNRRFRVSGRNVLGSVISRFDDTGLAAFEEVPADLLGYTFSTPRSLDTIFRARSALQVEAGSAGTTIFANETGWRSAPGGGTVLQIVDAEGSGGLQDAAVVTGDLPGLGYAGMSDQNGFFGVRADATGVVTSVLETELSGHRVTSAFTVAGPDDGRIEVPIERARRPRSPFARFGVFAGVLASASPAGRDRQLYSSGVMTPQDFYDDVRLGRSRADRAPILFGPTRSEPRYRAGVPVGGGHLVASEGVDTATGFVLEKIGYALDLRPEQGVEQVLHIGLAARTMQPHLWSQGLANLDPRLPPSALRLQLAGELRTGDLLDLVRDLRVSSTSGADVTLDLPERPTEITGYLAMLGGTAVVGGTTVEQRAVARLDGLTVPAVPQLQVPVLSSPAPGAVVAKEGFDVEFILPSTCQYGWIQLRSETATSTRTWSVIAPRHWTRVRFFTLPTEVPTVLEGGRSWTLKITAVRSDAGFLVDPSIDARESYGRVLSNFVGLDDADRGVSAYSSVAISITTGN